MGAFLIAEMGDKTQLVVISLGARFEVSILSSVKMWLGVTIGMVLANPLAVIIGHTAGRRLAERMMKRISGALFIAFGIWTLVSALI